MERLLSENEAAKYLNISVKTMQKWRWKGVGPSYVKMSHSVRYRYEDIKGYVEDKIIIPLAKNKQEKRI